MKYLTWSGVWIAFCVPCALKGKSQVSGDRFAQTDWEACTMPSLECKPGRQPSKDMRQCISCAQNEFSAAGDSCKICPSGTEPNEKQTECAKCSAGSFSGKGGVVGICLLCSVSPLLPLVACAVQTARSCTGSSYRMCGVLRSPKVLHSTVKVALRAAQRGEYFHW